MHILTCIICVKEVPRSDMISHIAEDLNYFRFHCNDCAFKTSYSHAIVEHELETSHLKQDIINQYLDRLCNIVYSDCVLREKNGIEAVFSRTFQPAAIVRFPEVNASSMVSAENSRAASVVSSSTALSEPRNRVSNANNGEWAIVGDADGASTPSVKQARAKSRFVTAVSAVKSKTTTNSTRCRSDSNVGSNCVDMECSSATAAGGGASLACRRCGCVIPNDYRSHKEHVQKMHADEDGESASHVESEITLIAHRIKQCFPSAVAVNDFQCTMCAKELRSSSGRRWHVAGNHLYICLECPSRTCAAQFGAMKLLDDHLKASHRSGESLTENEQTILKQTKDDHNAKLKAVLARCYPYRIPATDDNVDLLLSRSANITNGDADEEEEDGEEKETTTSHVSAMNQNESESIGGAVQSVDRRPPANEPTGQQTESAVRSRKLLSSSSESSVEPPLNRLVLPRKNPALLNIKREIKQEIIENAKKTNKRKPRPDSDSDSSSDAEQRRQKISRLVDDINLQEARRRNGLLLNRSSNTNKTNELPSMNNNDENDSLSSSSSDNNQRHWSSLARRVLAKTPPAHPVATSAASGSSGNNVNGVGAQQRNGVTDGRNTGGSFSKNPIDKSDINKTRGPLTKSAADRSNGVNGKRPNDPSSKNSAGQGRNASISCSSDQPPESNHRERTGGKQRNPNEPSPNNVTSNEKKSAPSKYVSPRSPSKKAKRPSGAARARAKQLALALEARKRDRIDNNNNNGGKQQRRRSPLIRRSPDRSRPNEEPHCTPHRRGRVPHRDSNDGRRSSYRARSAGRSYGNDYEPFRPPTYTPPLLHAAPNASNTSYYHHRWDGEGNRQVNYSVMPSNPANNDYWPLVRVSRDELPTSAATKCRMEYGISSAHRPRSPHRRSAYRSVKRETS